MNLKKSKMEKILTFILTLGVLIWASIGQTPKGIRITALKLRSNPYDAISLTMEQLLKMNTSYAATLGGGLVPNVINLVRNAMGSIIGYSSETNYSNLVCGGLTVNSTNCSGPPENGIIGTLTSIINDTKTVATTGGITSCTAVPAKGSITGKNSSGASVTITFETPTHAIPSQWVGGGTTFSKRAVFNTDVSLDGGTTSTPLAIAYEFNCGSSSAAYVAVSMTVGSQAAGYSRDIAVYNGSVDTSGTNGFQVFMAEHDRTDTTNAANRSAYGIDIHYNDTTKIFNLWGVLSGALNFASGNGLNTLMKLNVNGNYSTGKALVFNRVISMQTNDPKGAFDSTVFTHPTAHANDATLEADPGNISMDANLTSDATLRTSVANGSPGVQAFKACLDFSAVTAAATSSSDCSGFSLVTPTDATPAIDSTGTWSIYWTAKTLPSKLEALTIPSS